MKKPDLDIPTLRKALAAFKRKQHGKRGSLHVKPSSLVWVIAGKFRKKPVTVYAIRWMGGDTSQVDCFCGFNWGRADIHCISFLHKNDPERLVVWNVIAKQWLCVPVGSWIIRGIYGEFYPCADDIFDLSYEPVCK